MTTLGPVSERTTQFYTTTLKDEAGAALPLSAFSILTLTYSTMADGVIINSREDQNILNTNNVTVHATSGLLTWTLQPADTIIVETATPLESHRALFEWTLTNGHAGKHEVIILVRNVNNVP